MARVVARSSLLKDGHVDRLDAEYHSAEIVNLEEALAGSGRPTLGSVAALVDERVPDPAKSGDANELFGYLEISDIDPRDGFALAELIARTDAPSRARVKLIPGAIALSSVRPARNAVTYVTPDLAAAVGSTGLIIIEAKSVEPELLFMLLKTRPIVEQLIRRARASMYPALHPPDVLAVRLPELDERVRAAVCEAVARALRARDEYLAFQERAQAAVNAFLDRVDPRGFASQLAQHEAHETSKGALFSAQRIDAEFHAPAFQRLRERFEALGRTVPLADLVARAETGSTPAADAYLDGDEGGAGIPLIKVASISNRGVIWPSIAYARYPPQAAADIADGDVLFTSSAHASAHISRKVDVVRDIPASVASNLTYVGELMRIRLKADAEVSPEYLAAFLRHPLGGMQVRRSIRGITSHVYAADLMRNVHVPVPPPHVAEEITKAAAGSGGARRSYRQTIGEGLQLLEDGADFGMS